MPSEPTPISRALSRGPLGAPELCRQLGISQPTLSRAVRREGARIVVWGRARATRYAARREIDGVPSPVPVYAVRPAPEPPRRLLNLHPVAPEGFWLEPVAPGVPGGFTENLPWFLANLRPAGVLGRRIPRDYPDVAAPSDIGLWSADAVLRFATRHGWNLPGALIVGDAAMRLFAERAGAPVDRVAAADRERLYPALASSALSAGPAGSSAGGEQPKFLATVDHGTHAVPVLVKFSPPRVDDVGVRVADLLVSEHVAHEVLAAAGHPTARSTLVWAGDRVFLEVARFDRDGPEHRRGVIPLGAVDGELLVLGLRPAELVGSPLDRWSTTTAALVAQGQLTADDHREVRWREVFGDLVANTDMHANNLSLWLDDLALAGVAPSYDLLPMAYAVRQNELPRVTFAPRVPAPADADVARPAWEAAVTYWAALADHGEVSEAWRAVARDNHRRVAELGPAIGRLPR